MKITDQFWTPRLQSHATTTLAVCIDQIENRTGRIRNFENAAKGEGKHSGIFFDDSDVYKAISERYKNQFAQASGRNMYEDYTKYELTIST